MDALLIYLLKSSGLLAMFYLAYILFMQKETFFTSNRWFLVSGLLTSAVLPLFFITKIIFVESKPVATFHPINTNLKSPIQTFRLDANLLDSLRYDWFVFSVPNYDTFTFFISVFK